MKSTEYFYDYPRFNNLKELINASIEQYSEKIAFILKEKNKK